MVLEKRESGSWSKTGRSASRREMGEPELEEGTKGHQRGGGLGVCRIGTGGRDNRDYGWVGSQGKEKNQE